MSELTKFLLFAAVAMLYMLWAATRSPLKGGAKDLWKWVWGEPDDQDPADTPPKA